MASHDREATVRSNFASWTTRKGFVGLSRMLTVAVLLGLVAGTAHAAEANEQDGRAYAVDQLFLDFAEDLPVHPPAKSLMKLSVTLGVVDDGYVSPREGLQAVETQLADIPKLGKDRMYESAIRAISNTIVDHFRDWGYAGVVVAPHPSDIDPESGADQRLEGQTALRLVVRSMTGRGRPPLRATCAPCASRSWTIPTGATRTATGCSPRSGRLPWCSVISRKPARTTRPRRRPAATSTPT